MQCLLGLKESLESMNVPLLLFSYPVLMESYSSPIGALTKTQEAVQIEQAYCPKVQAFLHLLSHCEMHADFHHLTALFTDDYSHPISQQAMHAIRYLPKPLAMFCVDSSTMLCPSIHVASPEFEILRTSAKAQDSFHQRQEDWMMSKDSFNNLHESMFDQTMMLAVDVDNVTKDSSHTVTPIGSNHNPLQPTFSNDWNFLLSGSISLEAQKKLQVRTTDIFLRFLIAQFSSISFIV